MTKVKVRELRLAGNRGSKSKMYVPIEEDRKGLVTPDDTEPSDTPVRDSEPNAVTRVREIEGFVVHRTNPHGWWVVACYLADKDRDKKRPIPERLAQSFTSEKEIRLAIARYNNTVR